MQGDTAQTPPGRIDDTFEGKIIIRLGNHPQVGDGVADFQAFIEPRPTDNPVRQTQCNQAFLELAGLKSGAHEHRHFVQAVALVLPGFNFVSDDTGFLDPVPDTTYTNLVAFVQVCPQRLSKPPLVFGYQARGRRQNMGRGTVVAFQPHDPGAGEIVFKTQDVTDLGPAPGIDRLVVIANAAYIPMPLYHHTQPQVLGDVGILIFIDQDVAEFALKFLQDGRLFPEQLQAQ